MHDCFSFCIFLDNSYSVHICSWKQQARDSSDAWTSKACGPSNPEFYMRPKCDLKSSEQWFKDKTEASSSSKASSSSAFKELGVSKWMEMIGTNKSKQSSLAAAGLCSLPFCLYWLAFPVWKTLWQSIKLCMRTTCLTSDSTISVRVPFIASPPLRLESGVIKV